MREAKGLGLRLRVWVSHEFSVSNVLAVHLAKYKVCASSLESRLDQSNRNRQETIFNLKYEAELRTASINKISDLKRLYGVDPRLSRKIIEFTLFILPE